MPAAPLVFRLLLCIAYLAVGVFVLITRPFQSPMFDWPFAMACIAYGLFRGYRAARVYLAEKEEG